MARTLPDSIDWNAYVNDTDDGRADVRRASEFIEDLVEHLHSPKEVAPGTESPWATVGDSLRFREGEVTLWGGVNGHLVAKAVELAKAGDTTALRICIDRCIPAIKAKDQPISLKSLGGSPAQMGETVLRAMAAGEITPDEAAAVMQVVTAQMRIVEVDDLVKRIEALEGNGDGKQ